MNQNEHAKSYFTQENSIKPSSPPQTDEQWNFDTFILPILIRHEHLAQNDKGQFIITPEAYKDLESEDKQDLKILEKTLFSRYRCRGVEGLEGKSYVIEECDPKTGQVINATMYLTDGVREQDMNAVHLKAREMGVTAVAAETREVGMMYQRGQQQLLLQNEKSPEVIVEPTGAIRTRFGYIFAGVSLLAVRDLFKKENMLEHQKLKNFLLRARRKRQRGEELDIDDEAEAKSVNLSKVEFGALKTTVAAGVAGAITGGVSGGVAGAVLGALGEMAKVEQPEDSLLGSVKKQTIEMIDNISQYLNMDNQDIVKALMSPEKEYLFEQNKNAIGVIFDFARDTLNFTLNSKPVLDFNNNWDTVKQELDGLQNQANVHLQHNLNKLQPDFVK